VPRAVLAVPSIAFFTLALAGPALVAALVDRTGRSAHRIVKAWGRCIVRACGVDVAVSGAENLAPGPVVFAANHGSALDIPILFGYLPADFRVIHKSSLSRIPLLGLYLRVAGHVAMDRGNPFRATRSLAEAAEHIRNGNSVAAFPEGTRSRDGSVQPFKRGGFVIAVKAGVPLVPLSIVGVKQVAPRGILTLRPGNVRLRIHPAIPTAGRSADDAETLAEDVRQVVARGCSEA